MDIASLSMIVIMIAIFYFILIRPENKRKKQAEEMRSSIKKGDRITTIGGMKGRVVLVDADTVVFETSDDRVRIEIAKWGVQSTESFEQASAQKQGGLFGSKKEDKAEKAEKDESAGFDPEVK